MVLTVFQLELNGRLQIESLNEGRLVKCQSVANTTHVDALRIHSYSQL